MIQAILAIIKSALGLSSAIVANKSIKLPLQESEIRQRAENNAARLKRKGFIAEASAKWIATVKYLNPWLRLGQSIHAKNQVRDLIASKADILKIDIQDRTMGKRTGNWLVIEYMRDDYKREYLIEAK